MECGFTFKHYKEILELFLERGYEFSPFEYTEEKKKRVYLRHDIDHSIKRAVGLARIEYNYGVKATYCIRFASPFDNPFSYENVKFIDEIVKYGHYLALHYESREKTDYNGKDISYYLDIMKSVFNVADVVSFHRPTDKVFGKSFKGFVNVYDKIFYDDARYLSDSTGRWRDGCPCEWLNKMTEEETYHILIHPYWWERTNDDPCKHIHNFLKERMYNDDELIFNDNPFYKDRIIDNDHEKKL